MASRATYRCGGRKSTSQSVESGSAILPLIAQFSVLVVSCDAALRERPTTFVRLPAGNATVIRECPYDTVTASMNQPRHRPMAHRRRGRATVQHGVSAGCCVSDRRQLQSIIAPSF
jgi:hypothetical protein